MHQKSKPFIKYAYLALLSTTYILHYYLYVYAAHWVEKTKIKSTFFEEKKLFAAQAFSAPLNSIIISKKQTTQLWILFHIFAQCLKCNRILYICIKVVSLHNLHVVLTYKRNNIFFLISDILILWYMLFIYYNGRWIFQM